jgi:D-methionine transport system substrate-binding protein
MKRNLLAVVALLLVAVLAGCGGKSEAPKAEGSNNGGKETVLKIGATPVPHAEILNFVKPLAEKEGLKIQVIEFTDYVKPNLALADRELDANYFQHVPYLTTFAADRKLDLVSAGAVHLEPLGLYSVKVGAVSELKDGAQIIIPDDPSNAGRALNLLAQNGLITLKDGVGIKATPKDIVANPKKLDIKLLNAEQLPRLLQDADAAVINTNYYLEAQKNLKLNAKVLARESAKDNPYANIVAVRKGDEKRPEIQKLMKLLTSPEVRKFIEEKYQGAVIPAF